MNKDYQNEQATARGTSEFGLPGQASVSLREVVESAKEGLLALAVSTGLQVMGAIFGIGCVGRGTSATGSGSATGMPSSRGR